MKTFFSVLLSLVLLTACSDSETADPDSGSQSSLSEQSSDSGSDTAQEEVATPEARAERPTLGQLQEALGIPSLSEPWTGDLEAMAERRVIRVLTVYGLGRYFLDGGQEKGITYELFKKFEDSINKRLGRKHVRVHVVFIPVARHELFSGLLEGRGDIAAAGLTITPEREEVIDFTEPASRPLSEVLVTGPSAPWIAAIEDLAGQEIFVRASSSYRSSLHALNRRFAEEGRDEIIVKDVSEYLEDEDLLEMVNSGLLHWAVVDDYKADIWSDVFSRIVTRRDIVFREAGQLAFAIRENSPQLKEALNEFLKTHRQGTLTGNVLINRYFRDFDWANNALESGDYERFQHLREIFERYGDRYGVDFLIVAAQGYQESRLDQTKRSKAGAVGIMQLLPSTAADKNVGIPDITQIEPNIHAGVKYLNFIRNRYFDDPEIDAFNRTLFALAAYNAGPARVARLRNKANQQGYDPNVWFDNVELIAAREIGRETVQYVANIMKYYVAYRLSVTRNLQRQEERKIQGID